MFFILNFLVVLCVRVHLARIDETLKPGLTTGVKTLIFVLTRSCMLYMVFTPSCSAATFLSLWYTSLRGLLASSYSRNFPTPEDQMYCCTSYCMSNTSNLLVHFYTCTYLASCLYFLLLFFTEDLMDLHTQFQRKERITIV